MIAKFKHALNGISCCMKDKSIVLQCVLGLCTFIFFGLFDLNAMEWCLVTGCIGGVIVLEIINTCIEKLCNLYSEEHDIRIQRIKDMSAGMVLTGCVFALIIGVIIITRRI